jgi:hypothetical protein
MYSYTYRLTSTLDGGEWSALRADRFTPEKKSPVPTDYAAESAPQPLSTRRRKEKSLPLLGIEPRLSIP